MDEYLDVLNQAQKEAVISDSKYIRIIAGAGSGKTRVLTSRIYYLINELGIDPNSIVAITFTNKAANVMKERLNNMLKDKALGVHISTIHSFCVSILRKDIVALGYPRNFTTLDSDDQKSILREAYKIHEVDSKIITYHSCLDYIANNKYAIIDPQRALEMAGDFQGERQKALVYDYYEKRRQDMYALDFDDLLLYTTKLFDDFPEILEKWQKIYNYLLVDEFQDIDKTQYKLIKQLAGSTNDIYVVGDPDQTIYTWRGADINIIMNFDKDFKGTKTLMLKQNYRSDANILDGANSIIKNNRNRLEKDLFTEANNGELITHFKATTDEYEALWIASKIKELAKTQSLNDFAILYRANYLSRALEKSLINERIDYVIYGGIKFFERAEVKDALSYLRMIAFNDDLSFKRIINVPSRGIGEKTIDNILSLARLNNKSMYETIKENKVSKGKIQNSLDSFVQLIESFKEKEYSSITDLLEDILNKTGYRKTLEDNNEIERIENLKELINDIENFEDEYIEPTLVDYLQLVSTYTDTKEDTKSECVKLMTIHAAKGLEFKTVFVTNMSEGIFPSEKSLMEGIKGLEEERRLAYVAYTRAMKKLFLTESGGNSYLTGKPKTISRFIKEIDEKCIEHIGANFEYYRPKEEPLEEIYEKINAKHEISSKLPKQSNLRKGDMLEHVAYGLGVLLNIENGIMEVAFGHPFGVKKIKEGHPSIKKKDD